MADIVGPEVRSRMMAAVRGRDTKPELRLRRALHVRGLRYRLHARDLPGRPDLAFPRHQAVLFVHGCFWHRHPGCPKATTPATRPEFWQAKFDANVERDRRQTEGLSAAGWRVGIVWECALGRKPDAALFDEVEAFIRQGLDRLAEWPQQNRTRQGADGGGLDGESGGS